jgi:hypothetical protein
MGMLVVAVEDQAWLRRRPVDSFFPPRLNEATALQEGVGDHGHQRVAMKALPGWSLEVIKTESSTADELVRKSIVL